MRKTKPGRVRRDEGCRPEAVSEVPLTGNFAEFRQALRDEIDASKRAASAGAVPLRGGRLVATVAGGFQYEFEMESPLDYPGDAPGQLAIPGRGDVRVSIIQVQGTTLRLNVEQSLDQFIPVASLQSDLSMLMLKLIERIEKKSSLPGLAGARLFDDVEPQGNDAELDTETDERLSRAGLNEFQCRAVQSVLGRDTTYIWGPPGTGKTKTIGSIGAELVERGKSLLVVSHTNSAVDGALVEIASAMLRKKSEEVTLEDTATVTPGRLIRVGTPTDKFSAPFKSRFSLAEEVKRRSEELASRKHALAEERGAIGVELHRVQSELDLHLIVGEGDALRATVEQLAVEHRNASERVSALEADYAAARLELERLGPIHPAALAARRALGQRLEKQESLAKCDSEIQELNRQLGIVQSELEESVAQLKLAEELEPTRAALAALPAESSLTNAIELEDATLTTLRSQLQGHEQELATVEKLLAEVSAASLVIRMWKRMPDPQEVEQRVNRSRQSTEQTRARVAEAEARREEARRKQARRRELAGQLAGFSHIPPLDRCRAYVSQARRKLELNRAAVLERESTMRGLQADLNESAKLLDQFGRLTTQSPDDVIAKFEQLHAVRREYEQSVGRVRELVFRTAAQIEELLDDKLGAFHALDIIPSIKRSPSEKAVAFGEGLGIARARVAGTTPDELRIRSETMKRRLQVIGAEITAIENQLTKVADTVISEATVVGATLTAAYLRDAIQSRRFDTVLLDEASMASIPALWAAASTCDRALVIVGDFEQLPPVVIAESEAANKWLGTDAFEHRRIPQRVVEDNAPAYLVQLREQHRMASAVCDVANELVYGTSPTTRLQTAKWIQQREQDGKWPGWVSRDWERREPILLVDTHGIDAWVTVVARGKSSSRLNFLSATVCTDIARRMLSPDREAFSSDEARILIVSPYKPHAKLVSLMFKDESVKPEIASKEVLAGTAHAFQGAQADVVIVDLVNDTPHWKVGMFAPAYDTTTKRLINVAITRAKYQLIVVGDFKYCQQQARKSFLGRQFIPALRRHGRTIEAQRLVPSQFFVRAADAQSRMFGGATEAPHDRTVMRETSFYGVLATDLAAAREQVVIYSPFITTSRLANLATQLRALVERGVRLVVVTKTPGDRDKPTERREYERAERTLRNWGITVIHKKGMHEKLVLIDDRIVWTGSLNPLSFNANKTQEIMERRENPQVFKDYADTLMLDKLLAPCAKANPRCPICESEVLAAEGTSGPFFWKCSSPECGFNNAPDDTTLLDGEVHCQTCRGRVKLVEKPDRDMPWYWACDAGAGHKAQSVRALHLKLPKMRERIPKTKLKKVERDVLAYVKTKRRDAKEPRMF